MNSELLAILYSYIFLFGLVFLAEISRNKLNLASDFTRRVIHIGVGIWGIGALVIFHELWGVIIPPASFVIINFISYKTNLIKAIEIEDKRNLGTVFYPLSVCILLLVFWPMGYRLIPFLGLLIMALGDGFASIVGKRFGKHHYSIWANQKSVEGSIAMFIGAFLAVIIILGGFADMSVATILLRAAVCGIIATMIEGISPGEADNLTVPLFCSFAYWFIFIA